MSTEERQRGGAHTEQGTRVQHRPNVHSLAGEDSSPAPRNMACITSVQCEVTLGKNENEIESGSTILPFANPVKMCFWSRLSHAVLPICLRAHDCIFLFTPSPKARLNTNIIYFLGPPPMWLRSRQPNGKAGFPCVPGV